MITTEYTHIVTEGIYPLVKIYDEQCLLIKRLIVTITFWIVRMLGLK